jgi:predicted RNase H-like HicB family nuclease
MLAIRTGPTVDEGLHVTRQNLYEAAGRIYCLAKFDYNRDHYVSAEAREQHITNDAKSQSESGWFRAVVDHVYATGRDDALWDALNAPMSDGDPAERNPDWRIGYGVGFARGLYSAPDKAPEFLADHYSDDDICICGGDLSDGSSHYHCPRCNALVSSMGHDCQATSELYEAADHYTYQVRWSAEDREYVGTVAELPSLSWLAADKSEAFAGIQRAAAQAVTEMLESGERPPG